MGATGKEKLAAFRKAVAGIAEPGFRLDVSRSLADSARVFVMGDLARKITKRSGRLTAATQVGEVTADGFRMRARVPYAGTLNWGSNRIVRKRYAVHVGNGQIRFVPNADAARPGVFLLVMKQKYRKRQFVPARRLPAKWLRKFTPIVEAKLRAQVMRGWA